MSNIAVLYFSGYGHTRQQANAVISGLRSVNNCEAAAIVIDQEGNIDEQQWDILAAADGIIFGSPTYMGSVAWQFKKVADMSSKVWAEFGWKDKMAAGFTNSATINGDKDSTISYLKTFASQHAMLWMSVGQAPSNLKTAQRNDPNYLGGSSGLLAQSPSDSSPEEGPLPGDLETARLFGERFAQTCNRWAGQ